MTQLTKKNCLFRNCRTFSHIAQASEKEWQFQNKQISLVYRVVLAKLHEKMVNKMYQSNYLCLTFIHIFH